MFRIALAAVAVATVAACQGHQSPVQDQKPATPLAAQAAIRAQAPQPPSCYAVTLPAWNVDCDDTDWAPVPFPFPGHTGCYILVGDTSAVWCQDGGAPYLVTS